MLRQIKGANLRDGAPPPSLRLLPKEQILGRSEHSDLEVPIPTISRQHAVVWLKNGIPFVRDLDSGHGTFVNTELLTEPTALKDGDQLGLGTDIVLTLHKESDKELVGEPEESDTDKTSPLEELALSEGAAEGHLRELFRNLVQLQERIFQSRNEPEVLEVIADQLWEGINADRVIVFCGSELKTLKALTWRLHRDDEDPLRQPPCPDILTRGLLASGPLVTFDGTSSDVRSVVCIPLRGLNGLCGLLYADTLGRGGPHKFDDSNFISVVAGYASLKLREIHQRQEAGTQEQGAIKRQNSSTGQPLRFTMTQALTEIPENE
ncbi:MAG: FHA domain-containing protein [Deltaproteobacteria bacterium]|nr:FHA domain-containing protein [Deltaproteobacteria bacterium]